ncbi:hypothetical protein CY34DRAFT_461814 [Suillus luteus UH-Slu-Lm8-n1]|uniref:Uncharacterized protein n=1 Tax=Suillus luteus UH-Slu-Lm8-n1 TaxID=930992 RepID=A0A0C9ZIW4_9AGAM|nr:hypothetical protein CY34DRAFT_461814 [Suillus luteus UH-Slu-Lm8-n1]
MQRFPAIVSQSSFSCLLHQTIIGDVPRRKDDLVGSGMSNILLERTEAPSLALLTPGTPSSFISICASISACFSTLTCRIPSQPISWYSCGYHMHVMNKLLPIDPILATPKLV